MDTYLNDRQKETLLKVLDNPADSGSAYASNLAELAQLYPQSGLLRALLSRARNESEPAQATALFNGRLLHKLYHHPADLAEVINEQLIFSEPKAVEAKAEYIPEPVAQEPAELPLEPPAIWNLSNAPVAETIEQEPEPIIEQQAEETPEDVAPTPPIDGPAAEAQPETAAELPQPQLAPVWEEPVQQAEPAAVIPQPEPVAEIIQEEKEPEPVAEIPQVEPVAETPAPQQPAAYTEEEEEFDVEKYNAELNSLIDILEAENANRPAVQPPQPVEFTSFTPPLEASQRPQQPESQIEDDVFDEINEVAHIAVPEPAEATRSEQIETVIPELEQPFSGPAQQDAPVDKQHDEDTKLYQGSVIGSDYFRFDRSYREPAPEAAAPQPAAPLTPATIAAQAPVSPPAAEEQQDVSKYHDEQMPYSFMWWLDKTRKEHAQLYQPFVKAPAAPPEPQKVGIKKPADALQQQYFENIFHIASIEEFTQEEAPEPPPFDPNKKEDRIIERFIKEEPHINPPSGDRLDTENKAKRSSEDNDELVTETLAKIYADQMLYPKAIATYKKLMLKFPEKSSYFASRVEALERKTN